jgi:hypothetical protein
MTFQSCGTTWQRPIFRFFRLKFREVPNPHSGNPLPTAEKGPRIASAW